LTIVEDRLALLDTVFLDSGGHKPDGKFCVMEFVAYLAGEEWSASPACASPVITSFLVSWNDSLNDGDRQMLKPLIPLVIGTRTSKKDEETRAWMCTDWLARECAPAFLRCAGLTEQATLLGALASLKTAASARKAQPTLDRARKDSDAAADAARDAAWDAARVAARDAAWAAARDAAWAAAGAAAWDAAGDAARAAAWAAAGAAAGDAARDALAPTVKILQPFAYQLVERMCAVGRKP